MITKLKRGLICPLAIILSLISTSCSREVDSGYEDSPPCTKECELTVDDAKNLYTVFSEKLPNTEIKPGRLRIVPEIKYIDWERTACYRNAFSNQDNAEIPFLAGKETWFFSYKENGDAILLDSAQKLLVVRDQEGRSGVFLMTIIADRAFSRTHRKTDISSYIHNDGLMRDFSGIVLYSRLSGSIVRANRYANGKLTSQASLYNLPADCTVTQWGRMLTSVTGNLSVVRKLSRLKTRSVDPDSLDYFGGMLDSSICIDSAEVVPEDPFDPFDPFGDLEGGDPDGPSNGDEPDPGLGGGGGNGGGSSQPGSGDNNGNDGTNDPINAPFGSEWLDLGNRTLQIIYGENINDQHKSEFRDKLDILMGNHIFMRVLNSLFDLNGYPNRITVTAFGASSFGEGVSGTTTPSKIMVGGVFNRYESVSIRLNVDGCLLGYFEEFFHAQQYLVTEHVTEARIADIEFEAKAFLAKVISGFSDDDLDQLTIDNKDYFRHINDYINNRTPENRIRAFQALIRMGYYPMGMSYSDNDLDSHLDEILTTYHNYF